MCTARLPLYRLYITRIKTKRFEPTENRLRAKEPHEIYCEPTNSFGPFSIRSFAIPRTRNKLFDDRIKLFLEICAHKNNIANQWQQHFHGIFQ